MTYAQFTALASAFASQINAKLSHDFNIQTNGQLPSAQSFAAFQQQAKTTPCIPASPVGPQGPVGPIALSKSAGSSKGKSKSSKSKSSKSSKKQAKSSFSSSSSISNKALAPLSSTSAALAGVGIGGGVSEPLEILMECASQAHVSINIATAQLCVSAFLLDFASTPIKGPTPLLGITCLVVAANGPPALQIGG